MKARHILRSRDLAKEAGLSTQSIRNYEQYGFIPGAERESQGYRRYTLQHLHALRAARKLIAGYGWEHARRIMHALHSGELPTALAVIDERHAAIHRQRSELEETLRILHTTSSVLPDQSELQGSQMNHPVWLTVGQAAQLGGVRASAIRFWEAQGLIIAERSQDNRYRRYNAEQVRNIQVVALLRKAGYGIEAIRSILTQLATSTPEQAVAAAEKRLQELAEVSQRCMEATAYLWDYLEHSYPKVEQ